MKPELRRTTVPIFLGIFALSLLYSNSVHASSTADSSSAESVASSQFPSTSANSNFNCVTFDSEVRVITITCSSTDLTHVNDQLKNPDVLTRDNSFDKGWILNAGITIAQNAMLYINSSDTSWLKILADEETDYPIHVSGSLKIDSVKVTSWNPNTNNYTRSLDSQRDGQDVQVGTPRPYIVVDSEATGTMDITNSEIAYLGYESGYGGGRTGLRYEAGENSIITGNDIHDLYFGFYSKGVGGIRIEDNQIHNNIHYGLDPHTGTHDMSIKNNSVRDNGGIGIICSLDCYNIKIEDNVVYNNTKMGIMFSRNMTDSVARNNDVSNESRGIIISESSNNEIYNNRVSNSGSGIEVDEDSVENRIYNNTIVDIANIEDALSIDGDSGQNTFSSNVLVNSSDGSKLNLDVVGEQEDEENDDEGEEDDS
ncbi:MAG TPA: right-handed parallel beta-helix repeat-containing protein [Nitrososphaeraceae archaeon]|jgi:parallel beta-helix repeat protein|nr:right-handed parallel beta-helix repeat-containing protein [Nitrososphaeraceae archaeon]